MFTLHLSCAARMRRLPLRSLGLLWGCTAHMHGSSHALAEGLRRMGWGHLGQAAAEAQQLRELEDKVESLSAQLAATTDAQHAAEASLQ